MSSPLSGVTIMFARKLPRVPATHLWQKRFPPPSYLSLSWLGHELSPHNVRPFFHSGWLFLLSNSRHRFHAKGHASTGIVEATPASLGSPFLKACLFPSTDPRREVFFACYSDTICLSLGAYQRRLFVLTVGRLSSPPLIPPIGPV